MCVLIMCTIVVHSTALNSSDNLHSYPPDNLTAQMMSIEWEGDKTCNKCTRMQIKHRIRAVTVTQKHTKNKKIYTKVCNIGIKTEK